MHALRVPRRALRRACDRRPRGHRRAATTDAAGARLPPSRPQTTEWFSVEDYLALEDEAEALPRGEHHVTAVVVEPRRRGVAACRAHDAGRPDPTPGRGRRRRHRLGRRERRTCSPPRSAPIAPSDSSTASASAQAVRARPGSPRPAQRTSRSHPTSSRGCGSCTTTAPPTRTCLAAAPRHRRRQPQRAVLGPKVLGWHDRRLLLEAGVTVSGSGRRITGLERREHDQGQHDGVRDVLAVSSAGMLVRRDVWDALDGFDPVAAAVPRRPRLLLARPPHGRARPRRHRRRHPPPRGLGARSSRRRHRPAPHRADREAAVHVLLAQATALAAPFVALRLLLGSLVRAGIYLLGKDVAAARDEVGAVLALALHPSKVRSSRTGWWIAPRPSRRASSGTCDRAPGPRCAPGPRGDDGRPHDQLGASTPSARGQRARQRPGRRRRRLPRRRLERPPAAGPAVAERAS